METATAPGRVRRTVRVAVALVVGHALLGALIGWLTLGYVPASGPRSGSPAVDRLGAPPPRGLPPGRGAARDVTATVRRIEPAVRDHEPTANRRTSPPEARAGVPVPARVTPVPSPSASPTTRGPAAPAVSAAPSVTPSASPSPTVTTDLTLSPGTVTLGQPCWPEGTIGQTADGDPAQCREDGGPWPVWKIF